MEANEMGSKLARFALVEIPRVFQMAGWALVVGVAKYLGERFGLAPLHVVALVLSALMLAYVFAERRSVRWALWGATINFVLIALAWETASLLATLHATVTV